MNIYYKKEKIQLQLAHSLKLYRNVISYRDDELFTKFLPEGYAHTTLSSVDSIYYEQVMMSKIHLGMLITLLDDFADHPLYFNELLLNEMYKLPYHMQLIQTDHLSSYENTIIQLANTLLKIILANLSDLPNFKNLHALFKFDLLRIYQANHYSSLLTQYKQLFNSEELVSLRAFNMGIVIAGMIDIMGSVSFSMLELGSIRQILHLGQRYGSICNHIYTFEREFIEGDFTNEVLVKGLERHFISPLDLNNYSIHQIMTKLSPIFLELKIEQQTILDRILQFNSSLNTFSCQQYVEGLLALNILHASLQEII